MKLFEIFKSRRSLINHALRYRKKYLDRIEYTYKLINQFAEEEQRQKEYIQYARKDIIYIEKENHELRAKVKELQSKLTDAEYKLFTVLKNVK